MRFGVLSSQAGDGTDNSRHHLAHILTRNLCEETLRQELQFDDSILQDHFRDVTTTCIDIQRLFSVDDFANKVRKEKTKVFRAMLS